ncbi:MAG: hypothetical protein MUO21_12100, partial [Nitrososphaeraceae archaeon]|nr:hypothetical protein [Nitrososphaeraceae archaeon]
NDNLYKTQLGDNIMLIKTQMETNISFQFLLSYIYSRVYKCDSDMIKLISMYMSIKSPKDIILTKQDDGKYRNMMESALQLYGNSYGDSYGLIKIANYILSQNTITEEWCISHYLNYSTVKIFIENYTNLSNDIKRYEEGLTSIDQEITYTKINDLKWFDTHTPKLVDDSQIQQEDKIKVALMHGHSYNLVKYITLINNNYYINIFRPSIRNIYTLPKLYKVMYETKKKIINNSFLIDTKAYSTLLYINQTENSDTGDTEITFIENIPPTIISKVVPQILDDPKKYDSYFQEQETKKYLSSLGLNNSLVLKNYMQVLTDIKMDLYNNFDKNIFEKLKIIDERSKVKDLINNEFRNKKSEILQVGGNYRDCSFVQDIISLSQKVDNNIK